MAKRKKPAQDVSTEVINEWLLRRAEGYTTKEVVKEYVIDEDGSPRVVKQKEHSKYVPPDMSAIKTYLELNGQKNEFVDMSDEELEGEKQRLIAKLAEKN
ncbi:MAG: hypothetical protein R3Y23_02785 [Bacillota bacterium]